MSSAAARSLPLEKNAPEAPLSNVVDTEFADEIQRTGGNDMLIIQRSGPLDTPSLLEREHQTKNTKVADLLLTHFFPTIPAI